MPRFLLLNHRLLKLVHPILSSRATRFLAYACLCAAYLQGGLVKLTDFPGAVDEMVHFGLTPAPIFAALVILLELGASIMILAGWFRWLASLALAGFTVLATFLALRFWELPIGQPRLMTANAFWEHIGLAGGFLLIAWQDINESLRDARLDLKAKQLP